MKRFTIFLITITLAVVLAACGNDEADETEEKEQPDEDVAEQANAEVEVSDKEKVNDDDVVVNINDSGVKGTDYNIFYLQTKMQMQQFGQDIEDLDSIKEQTLDRLITQELLMQEAEKEGIEISDEEVNSELDEIKEQVGENFDDQVKEIGMNEESFKDQLSNELLISKYADEKIKTEEVSDDEAKEMYENLEQQNEEIADFDEIKDELKQSIEEQKKQEELQAKVEELKESADIEKLI